MIRDLDVVPTWTGVIKPHTISGLHNVGTVIGRIVQNEVTLMWRVWLPDGRVVRVPAEAISEIPPPKAGELDIPPVPPGAAIVAMSVSPTPAVRRLDLERRGRVLGATMAEMIEAGFVGPRS